MRGELQQAIEHFEQWLTIAREIGDPRGEGVALFNSALALDQLGERGEASERVKAALRIFEQLGTKHLAEKARAQARRMGGQGRRLRFRSAGTGGAPPGPVGWARGLMGVAAW